MTDKNPNRLLASNRTFTLWGYTLINWIIGRVHPYIRRHTQDRGRIAMTNLAIEDHDLTVTPAAQTKIRKLIHEADDDINMVRVFVSGDGDGGMDYGMTFADKTEALDSIMEGDEGFRIVIDPVALAYMKGAEIDYSENGANSSFVFNNVFKAAEVEDWNEKQIEKDQGQAPQHDFVVTRHGPSSS